MFKRTFPKGKVLFKEGEPGLEAVLVEKGKVLILKKLLQVFYKMNFLLKL